MREPERLYYSVPGVATVSWDELDQVVLVEWDGWAKTAEFEQLLDAEVKALQAHSGSRLLADCRRQRALNQAAQFSAEQEWSPRVIEAGLKRFAVVLPESDQAAAQLRERLGRLPKGGFKMAYFTSLEEARKWLAR
jgi:hypothetical protein